MGFGWEVPHDDSAYLSPLGTNRRATSSGSRLPILNPCHAGRTTKRCSVICGLNGSSDVVMRKRDSIYADQTR